MEQMEGNDANGGENGQDRGNCAYPPQHGDHGA